MERIQRILGSVVHVCCGGNFDATECEVCFRWEGVTFSARAKIEDGTLEFIFQIGDHLSPGVLAYFGGLNQDESKNDGDWRILGVSGAEVQSFGCEAVSKLIGEMKPVQKWRVFLFLESRSPLKLLFQMSDEAELAFFIAALNV